MATDEPVLALSGITKAYPSGGQTLEVLRGVELSLAPGETVAITGPSGSGKTTLLNLLAGLDRPTGGVRRWRGESMEAWNENRLAAWRRQHVGFVFQDFRLLPRLTAEENVALPLELLGHAPAAAARRAAELLEALGMAERLGHFPGQLSGGEQQRVAIGRAFAHDPLIVFADEPTGNLDPKTSGRVLEQLLAMHGRVGSVLVTVTHDLEVAGLMERHISLHEGRVA